jgi:hypothetical protein
MHPDNGTKCWPHFVTLSEYAASGFKHLLALAEYMKTETDTHSVDLQPIAQALTEISMRVLFESYAEYLMLFTELGLQETVQAAIQPDHQTEPDLLERSMKNAI